MSAPELGTSEKLDLIMWQLVRIQHELGELKVGQADIQAAVQTFTTVLADVQAQAAQLVTDVTEIQQIVASGQPVDTSALDNIASQAAGVQNALDSAVQQVTALATPSTPPSTPSTPPTS
jgi:hypothetical protein